jgi:hypothetical protein
MVPNLKIGRRASGVGEEICIHLRSSAFICVHLRSSAVTNLKSVFLQETT